VVWEAGPATTPPTRLLGTLELALAQGATYTLTDLGANVRPYALNNNGQVAGRVYSSGEYGGYCFLWDAENGMRSIASQTTLWDRAEGINDAGVVVGCTGLKAWVWDPATGLTNIGTLPGHTYSAAHDVNESGQVTGVSAPSGNWSGSIAGTRAFRWTPGTPPTMVAIPFLPGQNHAYGVTITNDGRVLGSGHGAGGLFQWDPGTNTTSPLVTPAPTYAIQAYGGCHEVRNVCGDGPFVWDAEDGYRRLGAAGATGVAWDVNANGLVVGQGAIGGAKRAVIWGPDQMVDLNGLVTGAPGWVLQWATEVNNSGVIAGWGTLNGTPRGFLLTPSMATYTISGMVKQADGTPIEGVVVTARRVGANPVFTRMATTGTLGNYTIGDLPAGGYEVAAVEEAWTFSGGASLNLPPSAVVDFVGTQGRTISGTVGGGFEGALVSAYVRWPHPVLTGSPVLSDGSGRFSLILPAEYWTNKVYLRASRRGCVTGDEVEITPSSQHANVTLPAPGPPALTGSVFAGVWIGEGETQLFDFKLGGGSAPWGNALSTVSPAWLGPWGEVLESQALGSTSG